MSGTWSTLLHQPPAAVDTMLLLTDGTIVAHQNNGSNWYRLTPTAGTGAYETGTWSTIAPMPPNPVIATAFGGPAYGPQFFGSCVLKDGRLLVLGGEYNFGHSCDMAAGTIYDPVANSWTNVTTPAGWTHVGDVPLTVMPDGRVLIGNIDSNQTAFFNPATLTYTAGPAKHDQCAEESFTLLADGTVLAVQCSTIPGAEKYVPASNSWVLAGHTTATLPQSCPGIIAEIGPSVVLTNGHVLVIGATGNTSIYSPPLAPANPGTWSAGPTLHDANGHTLYPIDAPCVLMPNGKVLLAASPGPPCGFPGPTYFLEYDPGTNTVALVGSPVNSGNPCFTGRFILTPSGKVLFSNQGGTVSVYTPSGGPSSAWRPTILSFPASVNPGHTYVLTGQQLNGLSQCCTYGDDATMATNYPIARLANNSSGAVTYLRTANHSTMAIATGTLHVTTEVTIPASLALGNYTLTVIANGIPSATYPVAVVKVKEHKDFKEFKEFKVEIKEFEVKLVNETKFKDSEATQEVNQLGDPALHAAIQNLGTRVDNLTTAVQQQRAPITPEERPAVGELPLVHSAKKLTPGT